MRIIDKHITLSLLRIFTTTVFVFCFMYILIDITSQLDELIDRKVPLNIIVKFYANYFPIILVQISSIACLIAALFTYGGMNNSNELIVLRASGLNFWQITRPAIIFGLLISVLIFWVNEKHVPKATMLTKKIRNENMLRKEKSEIKKHSKITNLTFYGLKNRLYFIDTYNPNERELEGITIIGYDENQNIREKVNAYQGKWTGIAWKFYQVQITSYDSRKGFNVPLKVKVYGEKLMDIEEDPDDFLRQRLNVSAMNVQQLLEYINRFSNSGAIKALNNLKVDMHQKIASPFGNFFVILVGLPFALMLRSRKSSTFASVGLALGIGFLYYVANAVCLAFGKGGWLPPFLSAWTAPIIVSCSAFYFIHKKF